MNMILTLLSSALLSANLSTPAVATINPELDIEKGVQHLSEIAPELKTDVLKMALNAYKTADERGDVKKKLLTVIDYSLPSSKKRMWVFDLNKEELLYKLNVAHGKNSGGVTPHKFSNTNQSKQGNAYYYICYLALIIT